MSNLRLLGLPGSLRRQSLNKALLADLARASPEGTELSIFGEMADVPLFNEDDEPNPPPAVRSLWSQSRAADGLVIATPEYNQGLPAATKNIVDWLSRDPAGSPLSGKPVAVTGVTSGLWGTRLAQQQLRSALTACGALVIPAFLFVANGHEPGSDRERYAGFMKSVADWSRPHPV